MKNNHFILPLSHVILRFLAVLSVVLAMTPIASLRAAPFVHESFDYPGSQLNGANGGGGWRDSWKATPQLDADSVAQLGAINLPAPVGYPPATGKSLVLADPGGQPTAYRGLSTNAFLYFDEDRTYFVSFLVRRNQGGYAFALRQGANTTVVGVSVSTGGAITLSLDGQSTTSANVIANDVSYLIVLKIETSASGQDRVFLRHYAETQTLPAEEPETWLLEVATATNLFAERVALLGGGNRTIEFDELRIGPTWARTVYEVPSTYALTLEQSGDLQTWIPINVTADMIGPDGRIFPADVDGNNFFRMRIERQDDN